MRPEDFSASINRTHRLSTVAYAQSVLSFYLHTVHVLTNPAGLDLRRQQWHRTHRRLWTGYDDRAIDKLAWDVDEVVRA